MALSLLYGAALGAEVALQGPSPSISFSNAQISTSCSGYDEPSFAYLSGKTVWAAEETFPSEGTTVRAVLKGVKHTCSEATLDTVCAPTDETYPALMRCTWTGEVASEDMPLIRANSTAEYIEGVFSGFFTVYADCPTPSLESFLTLTGHEWDGDKSSVTLSLQYEGSSPATPIPYTGVEGGDIITHDGLTSPLPPSPLSPPPPAAPPVMVGSNLDLSEEQLYWLMDATPSWFRPSKRIYSMTEDGSQVATWASAVGGLAPLLTVIHANGKIFGGFNTRPMSTGWWTYAWDSGAFLLQFDNMNKHELVDYYNAPYYSLYDYPYYGPTWGGGHDLTIQNGCGTTCYLDDYSSYCNVGSSFECKVGSYGSSTCNNDFCGAGSGSYWAPDEVEVYATEPPDPSTAFVGSNIVTEQADIDWMLSIMPAATDTETSWFVPGARMYSMIEDGSMQIDYQNKVGATPYTLTVIKHGDKVFGGFATRPMSDGSFNTYRWDSGAFLFSVTNQYKHEMVDDSLTSAVYGALYSHQSYGPTFGYGHDFCLNCGYGNYDFTSWISYVALGNSYQCRVGTYYSSECNNDFSGTEPGSYWNPDDFEVWTIPAPPAKLAWSGGSHIMTEQEDMDWLASVMPSHFVPASRLYSMTDDGSYHYTFQQKVGSVGPTLVIVSANGKKFGGFTTRAGWADNWNSYYYDAAAFMFSVDNQYVHEMYEGNEYYGTYISTSYGPTFGGGHDMNINAGYGSIYYDASSYSYCAPGNTYYCRVGSYGDSTCSNDFCGAGAWSYFAIDDMEVWTSWNIDH